MRDRSILICDDEVEIVEELAEFFHSCGWQVRLACTGADAKRILLEGGCRDVLLTDLRLDDVDGSSLVTFSSELPAGKRPQLHAIMTGYVVENTTAEELGADALYLKPVDPLALVKDVEHRLALRDKAAPEDG
ncbi:CheY-like chemotaxis protein [Amorphus suaedae]